MKEIRLLTPREIDCRVAQIKGYEGLYAVTSDGAVIGLRSGKELKPMNMRGYLRVKLYRNAQPKMYSIHRLVASAFIPNDQGKEQVNHKDGNKSNNNVSNLEWVTQSENQIHAYINGLNSSEHANMVTRKRIEQKTMDGNVLKTWNSMSEASRATGIPISNITHCCRGRIKHAGGFKWDYLDC